MSKFTTEVRRICETYANDSTLSIEETIETAAPYIFSDVWNATDEKRKKEIEFKILRRYYMREIGYETVPLWKFKINAKLAEVMPRYNILYSSLDDVKAKLFDTVDFSEQLNGQAKGNTKTSGKGFSNSETENTANSSANSSSTQDTTTTATGKQTQTSDTTETRALTGSETDSGTNKTESNTSTTSSGTGENWQKFNDTPQGAVTGLENDTYLTNATKNTSTSSSTASTEGSTTTTTTASKTTGDSGTVRNAGTATTDDENTGTTKTTATAETTTKNEATGSQVTNSETSSNSDSLSENESLRHIYGKNGGGSYSSQYMELVNSYRDVDEMLLNELDPLFIGLWE